MNYVRANLLLFNNEPFGDFDGILMVLIIFYNFNDDDNITIIANILVNNKITRPLFNAVTIHFILDSEASRKKWFSTRLSQN